MSVISLIAEYGILDNYNPEQGIANGKPVLVSPWADKYITHVKNYQKQKKMHVKNQDN